VDEFNTIWAARHVLIRGIPSFPSGNIYPHGFVFTYLVVPFVLGDFSEPLARLPGLLVSLAGIPVAYWVGRKLFDHRVGLIVAAVMAVDPDGILWGGRARMYGLLQLLTLLVVYLYFRGMAKDRVRDRRRHLYPRRGGFAAACPRRGNAGGLALASPSPP
jgi:4-amino-4-deoxy-L-arabinose transferase-like glycosyltransferase